MSSEHDMIHVETATIKFDLHDSYTVYIKGIEKVRFYTSLCQESSLLSRQSVRRLLCPFWIENIIRIFWIIIRKVSATRFILTRIYSHLSTSESLIFNIRFISIVYNRRIKSLN
jgi:hypothetical protein